MRQIAEFFAVLACGVNHCVTSACFIYTPQETTAPTTPTAHRFSVGDVTLPLWLTERGSSTGDPR